MVDHKKMVDIDNYKHEHISKNEIVISMPSNEVVNSQTTSSVQYNSDNYKHVMECINGLENTMSTIASSIQPLNVAWSNKGFHSDSDHVRLLSFPYKHLFT